MNILSIAQIVVSIILIVLVLIQQGESGLGSAFGQDGGGYSTRRGAQKYIFNGTIVFGVLFLALAVFNLL
ncbi:MAG: preprotein translocase subunit SecG [Candidatus Pacebacteria bacterium]|nr:preprotein translocase subunit SecG [Candidatus Paceibacterota bacterium]